MNKNHFIFSYAGNKRQEVKNIYDHVSDRLTNDIKNIIEPFCGTSALSFYISLQHPKKFTYYLNDNNKHLIELYKIMMDEKKSEDFLKDVNDILKDDMNKEKYKKIIKEDTVISFYIKSKIFYKIPGLFPLIYKYKEVKFDAPIINFLRTEKIILSCDCAIKIYEDKKMKSKNFIFMDPPYIMACNSFYNNQNMNIYEHINKNNFINEKSKIIFCLENNWIIKLLFENYTNKIIYDKRYEISYKTVKHIIISN